MTTEATHVVRSVAITGAGSRLGREIAIGFAGKVYRVFGTAGMAAEIEEVRQATHGVADLAVCDITDEDAVRGWARDRSDELGDAGLDVLISNAGILTPGPLEVPADRRHQARVRGQRLPQPGRDQCVPARAAQGAGEDCAGSGR
jgi:NAD(P)-dependent dehydrogenase (short-subunit alcohol dehydrogenase family)